MNRSLAVLALMFAGMGAVKAQGFELENGKADHTFYPDGKADTALVKYALWDYDNPTDRDTLTWNIYIRWGADTKSWMVDMLLAYPNPVADVLHVVGVDACKGQLIDAKGSVVRDVVLEDGKLDVSELPSGVYALMLQTPTGIARVGFVRK